MVLNWDVPDSFCEAINQAPSLFYGESLYLA